MAISKKNSRLINCNGREFRWTISPTSDYIKFIAESAEKAGRKIEVAVNSDINQLWLAFPNLSDLNLRVIKPNEAASLFYKHCVMIGNPKKKEYLLSTNFKGMNFKGKKKSKRTVKTNFENQV